MLAWRAHPPRRLVDVGTGAGFPGLPLKILYPGMQLTLVESVGKKAMFCEHIVRLLNLDRVEVIKARVEDVGCMPEHRESYEWAVARAVADMRVLVEYLLPLLRVGGTALALKGESGPLEANSADRAMRLLGGRLRQVIQVSLPGIVEERYLVLVEKAAATPPKYPRKAGMPMKHPLCTAAQLSSVAPLRLAARGCKRPGKLPAAARTPCPEKPDDQKQHGRRMQ